MEQGSLLWAVPQTWDLSGAVVKNLLHATLSATLKPTPGRKAPFHGPELPMSLARSHDADGIKGGKG